LSEYLLVGIAGILILGITAQWLAWRLRLPSILLLLIFGFVAGPVTGFIKPDELLDDLLFPIVSLSVALILFEGGLNLKVVDLRQTGHVVRNLVTVGVLFTWLASATAAYFILDFALPLALLFGAILVVTGPTVIIPLLRHIRPAKQVDSIAKWEGIVNDPIGAILAVLVFEAIVVSGLQETVATIIISLLQTILIGFILGGFSVALLILLLKRYWIPGYLQSSFTLIFVVVAFVASNLSQAESGLFTVTLMGVFLANQKLVSIKHIVEFKENLGILLLSGLFIILAARLKPEALSHLGLNSLIFLIVLVLLIRPIAVALSTIKSGLGWRDKLFLSWMAPRGIVAAAVMAVFALELSEKTAYIQAERMVPEMFFIIVGTVAIYSLSAAPLGRWLNVAQPNPQGILIVGAHDWARAIAEVLQAEGFEILLVDTDYEDITAARLTGLPTFYASILSNYILDEIELGSLGRLLALTSNDEVNALAALHFVEVFDRTEVYQLAPKETDSKRKETISLPLRGRLLFNSTMTYAELVTRFRAGASVKTTALTEQFDYDAFQELYGEQAIPLFLITKSGDLRVFTANNDIIPQPSDSLISLIQTNEVYDDDSNSSALAEKQKLSEIVKIF
jgi:NhaP-type Na+/H+ or K+/H+ antiporter